MTGRFEHCPLHAMPTAERDWFLVVLKNLTNARVQFAKRALGLQFIVVKLHIEGFFQSKYQIGWIRRLEWSE